MNECLFLNGVPDNLQANLAMLDELGGPKTYGHYPNGSAMAFNTPFKRWKSYEFNGDTADPCIISWLAGSKAKGEIHDLAAEQPEKLEEMIHLWFAAAGDGLEGAVAEQFSGGGRDG